MNIGCHVSIAKGIDKAPEIAGGWAVKRYRFLPIRLLDTYCGDKRETAKNFRNGVKIRYQSSLCPCSLLYQSGFKK